MGRLLALKKKKKQQEKQRPLTRLRQSRSAEACINTTVVWAETSPHRSLLGDIQHGRHADRWRFDDAPIKEKVCASTPAKPYKSTPTHTHTHGELLAYTLCVKLAVTVRHIAAPSHRDMIESVKVAACSSLAVRANQPGQRDEREGVWSSEQRAALLHLLDISSQTKEKCADGGVLRRDDRTLSSSL